MNETKLNWSDLQLFLAVARGGGLASGAVISGQSAPTLGRHMLGLERALGEVLFNRLPRGYELTKAGQKLLEEAEIVEGNILSIERRHFNPDIRLPVHITSGTWMTRFLARHFKDISTGFARLVFQATEAQQSITRRQATIGLRNSRPIEEGLAARKSARVAFAPYATKYSATQDVWIASTAHSPSANWVRTYKSDRIKVEVTNPGSLLDLVHQDAGHAVLPCFVGDSEPGLIRSGEIITALTHDQWLVVHGEDRNLPPVRATVERIARLIRSNRTLFEGIGT